jgi:hypothetical protein
MTSDRRRSFRARCDLAVTWRRGPRAIPMRAVDFSARGLFLLTDEDVDLGFMMDLVIELPDGPIHVFGVARNVGDREFGRGVGIALMCMDDEESARWWSFYRSATAASVAGAPPVAGAQPIRLRLAV